MNIAIMICGHWRNGSKHYTNFLEKILKPNREHNIDLFVVTSAVNSERFTHSRSDKNPYIKPVGDIKHDDRFSKENGRIYNISEKKLIDEIRNIYNNDNLVDVHLTKENVEDNNINGESWEYFRRGIFSKPYEGVKRIDKYHKENSIKYDVILRTRPDLILHKNVIIEKPIENTIYTIGGYKKNPDRLENGVSLCDFFAYGDYVTMKNYADIHTMIEPLPSKVKHPFKESGENQLDCYLTKMDIGRKFVINIRREWHIPR